MLKCYHNETLSFVCNASQANQLCNYVIVITFNFLPLPYNWVQSSNSYLVLNVMSLIFYVTVFVIVSV